MARTYYTFCINDTKGKIYPRTTNGEIVTKWTDQLVNCGYWDSITWFADLLDLYQNFHPQIVEIQVEDGRVITK